MQSIAPRCSLYQSLCRAERVHAGRSAQLGGRRGGDLVQAPDDQQLLLLIQLRVRVVHVRALTLQGSQGTSALASSPLAAQHR